MNQQFLKYKTLAQTDIWNLILQNEKDIIDAKKTEEQRELQKNHLPIAFDRRRFYEDVFNDEKINGFVYKHIHGTIIKQARRSYFYRGENKIFATTRSSLYRRLNSIQDKEEFYVEEFVSKLKISEFKRLINKFNHIHVFTEIGITILYEHLAQHYGFETQWLDITNDFKVALFFACCKYNNNSKNWEPLNKGDFQKDEASRYGVVIRKRADMFSDFESITFGDKTVLPIGFQPFMRSHMQTAYAIQMEREDDLKKIRGFEIYKFIHNEYLSNWIFREMDEGRKIFPHEGIDQISDHIELMKQSKEFSVETFDEVCRNTQVNIEQMLKVLRKYKYRINHSPIALSRQRIRHINRLYKNFDIEKEYGIKLRTRITYIP